MGKKKLKKEVHSSKKRNVQTDNQKYKKVFTEEEVREKEGIVSPDKVYFIAILQVHILQNIYRHKKNDMTKFAEYLDKEENLFIKTHGVFKLMKVSSILAYIHRYSKEAKADLKEKMTKEKEYKSKK